MYSLRNLRQLDRLHRFLSSRRFVHQEVRVRFAPSPTGHLHLGGLRTALYNYLYAKSFRGKFILRIEDTDQTRLVPGATESLIEDLLWSGIEIDEGPGSFGGEYGPYIQSERNQIYNEYVQRLLENGSAYRCFCSEHRLDLIRKDAIRTRQVPRYDNNCRYLEPGEIAELLEQKVPHCIRFKLTEHTEPLNDLIYGKVLHNVSENEGDPVIIKTDNFPTYHFANVVDDHMMQVTHVFRGVEWQISTTKHLLLYKAFGWKPPQFGHLPLLVNADGTKLSKRQGDIGIKSFKERGYFPEAVVNYVMSAGGGFEREQSQKPKIYTLADLANQFNIDNVNSHPSRLNPDILNDFNRLQIIELLSNEDTADKLVNVLQTLVKEQYSQQTQLDLEKKHVLNILRWAVNRITFLKDLTTSNYSFLWVKPSDIKLNDITKEQLENVIACLETLEFTKEIINAALRQFATKEGLKIPVLMKALRSAISGLKEGPGVAEMMSILGKEVVLDRMKSMLKVHDLNNPQRQLSDAA